MKEATLKQARKVLDLIGQKDTPCEQLQKLLGSGLLSDLLDANVDSVDRNTFRQTIGLKSLNVYATIHGFTITINYDHSVKDSIKAGKYDWENDDITEKHFPSQETGTMEVAIELFHFGKNMETDKVLAELDKKGYRPATLKELLALGEKHPDLQREFTIIALGSVWRAPDGSRRYACLDRDGFERYLYLYWLANRWRDICRFAAVRK
ncbi:hypothetical protein KKB71_00515 [Patescibacteria group bacterium]|nr:hypothetical protein [Patescibacteria group bacterium]MBU2219037.1 hypothetical protein [Patescibacteria group bacterium]MBU2263614.1 hypothetical protein [Patescibacteria group bacterium]